MELERDGGGVRKGFWKQTRNDNQHRGPVRGNRVERCGTFSPFVGTLSFPSSCYDTEPRLLCFSLSCVSSCPPPRPTTSRKHTGLESYAAITGGI